jgi:hypothetical protein
VGGDVEGELLGEDRLVEVEVVELRRRNGLLGKRKSGKE